MKRKNLFGTFFLIILLGLVVLIFLNNAYYDIEERRRYRYLTYNEYFYGIVKKKDFSRGWNLLITESNDSILIVKGANIFNVSDTIKKDAKSSYFKLIKGESEKQYSLVYEEFYYNSSLHEFLGGDKVVINNHGEMIFIQK